MSYNINITDSDGYKVTASDNDGYMVNVYTRTPSGFKDQYGNLLIDQDGTIFRSQNED